MLVAKADYRSIWRCTIGVLLGFALMCALLSDALAASPACQAVNAGQLNYSGSSPVAQLGVVLGQFYPGDQLFMTYTSNSPKAGVVLDLILTSVSINTATTNGTGTTQSLTATVGALLPIGAKAGITDATALTNPRNVVMTVSCTPVATPVTVAVAASVNPTVFGQPTTLTATATASSGVPNGNVVFSVDGVAQPPVTLSNGVATLTLSTLAAGPHAVGASYAGNTNFATASNTLSGGLTVNKAATATTLTSASPLASFGSPVTWTATTTASAPGSGTPTGSIIFTIDGVDQTPVSMSAGSAALTINSLAVGSHDVGARYGGTSNYVASAAVLAGGQTITKAATSIALTQSSPTSTVGQTPSFRATVVSGGGTPTGAVVFTIDGVAQPTVALSNGVAELTVSGLAIGNHVVGASYPGTANLAASSTTLSGGHEVGAVPTAMTLSSDGPVVFGNDASVRASVTAANGTPTGSLVFTVDGIDRAPVALSNGSATIGLSALAAGSHTVSASYAGSTTFAATSAALAGGQVVTRAPTTTTLDPVAAVGLGQSVSLAATVTAATGTVEGTVTFTIDGAAHAPVTLSNGKANLVVPGLLVGSHAVTATYGGATNLSGSTASGTALVDKAAPSLALNASANPAVFGQPVTVTATAIAPAGVPTGSMIFTIDGVDQSPVGLASGSAAITLPALSVGTHRIAARFGGDAQFLPVASSLPDGITVKPVTTAMTLSASPAPARFGDPLTLSAHVAAAAPGAGTPAGDVIFMIDGVAQAPTVLSNGVATLTTAGLTVGQHTVRADFAAHGNFAATSAMLTGGIDIGVAPTETTVSGPSGAVAVGQPARLVAEVAASHGVPTGTVLFAVDGVDQVPVVLSQGRATLDLVFASAGSHVVHATYIGSADFGPSSASLLGGASIEKAASATALTVAPTSTFGAPLTVSAKVTAGAATPGGSVVMFVDGVAAGTAVLTGGVATLVLHQLDPGSHHITAAYAGALDYAASTATGIDIAVTPAPVVTTLSSSAPTLVAGAPVTILASVMSADGPAVGDVAISVGNTDHRIGLQNGVATLVAADLSPGTYPVSVAYAGSAYFGAGSAALASDLVVQPAPTDIVVAADLPRSVTGQAFSINIAAYGGVGPYRFAVTGGMLPAGLALDPATGTISGIPQAAGDYPLEITVSGSAGRPGTFAATLRVLSPATITLPPGISSATFGIAVHGLLAATGGTPPMSYAVTGGRLPANLVLDPATGTLSGTPRELGTARFTIEATDANGFSGSRSYALAVEPPALAMSGSLDEAFAGEPFSARVSVTGGTQPYNFSLQGPLAPGLTLDRTTGVISGAPSQTGTFASTILASDADGFAASLAVSMTVMARPSVALPATLGTPRENRPYAQSLSASGGAAPYRYTVLDGATPPGLMLDAVTGRLAGTPTGSGNFAFTVEAVDANGLAGTHRYTLVVEPARVMVVDATLQPAIAGVAFSGELAVTGGNAPYRFVVISGSLPPGISLNADTGLVAGTTLSPGAYAVVLDITDADGNTVAAAASLQVAAPTINVTSSIDDTAVGSSMTGRVTATGGTAPHTYAVSNGALPNGVVLDATTGAINGQADAAGSFRATITATDVHGFRGSTIIDIAVAPAAIALSGLPGDLKLGRPVNAALVASGGHAPYHFAISGNLPPGLSLDAGTGVVSGTPVAEGEWRFIFTATDANGVSGAASYTMAVLADQPNQAPATTTTTTSLAGPQGDVALRQSLRFIATVIPATSGAPISGTVTFWDNGVALATVPVVNGVADHAAIADTSGPHTVTAAYNGDAAYGASRSPAMSHAVLAPAGGPLLQTTTTVSSDVDPQIGGPLVLSARVVADGIIVPTGDVEFINDTTGVRLGRVALDDAGAATLTLPMVDAGETMVSAIYGGDSRLLGSAGTLAINPALATTQTTLTASASSVQVGASVILSAGVVRRDGGLPNPGVIAFFADGSAFAHVPTNGSARVEASSDALTGATLFSAQFIPGPSGTDASSVSPGIRVATVQLVPVVSITAAPASDGSAAGTVTVTPPEGVGRSPSGTITLTALNTAPQTLPLTSGVAAFAYPAGTFAADTVLKAHYQGDAWFAPADASVTITPPGLVPTRTLVELPTREIGEGEPMAATIRVLADPIVEGGMVEVSLNHRPLGTVPVEHGQALLALSQFEPGNNTIAARFLGTAMHAASDSEVVSVTMWAAPQGTMQLALASDPGAFHAAGQQVAVTAALELSSGSADNLRLTSSLGFSCPRLSLSAGETLRCTATYVVSEADLDRGQIEFTAAATADGVAAAAADRVVLMSVANTIATTFETLSNHFVADRARTLSAAIPLPDILVRRVAGTRAGTVEASHDETGQIMAFASSLAEWRNWAAAQAAEGLALGMLDEPLPVNVWIDAHYAIHAVAGEEGRWGHLATAALGADYLVTEDVLAGLMVQGDWSAEQSPTGSVDGSGFLIGPYVSVALSDNLAFDATILYGRSNNRADTIVAGEAFSGAFATTRFYAKASLSGHIEIDQLTVRPNALFVLTSESADDYTATDGAGNAVIVPGGEHGQYRLTAGATAEYAIALDDGATFTPKVGLDLGLAGDLEEEGDPASAFVGTFTTGFGFTSGGGLQLGIDLSTNMDTSGFSASSLRGTVRGGF